MTDRPEDRPAGDPDDDAPDAFARGQADAELLRELLDGVREDVAAMVREEVARAGISRADLERMVREEAAGRERRTRPGAAPSWRAPALVVGGVVVGLAAGVLGYRALESRLGPGGADGRQVATTATSGAAEDAGASASPSTDPGGEVADGPSASPGERAALYDSLLDARSDRLEPMVSRLEAAGPAAPVTAAIETWRAGEPLAAGPARRLHDALVQLALNEEAGAGLTLDGLLTRDPCRGNSCGALLELWRSRGDELGMPPLPPDPAAATPTLAVVERVLVLERMDEGGGG